MEPGTEFLDRSQYFLTRELLPKIRAAILRMNEEDLWWRPNDTSNSIGNLMLHLAGNVRQWIVSGVGGAADVRRRQEEFDQRAPIARDELLEQLTGAVEEAVAVIASLPRERLAEEVEVQGRRVSALEAIYHVVEHFSMHTGQILYIAKLRSGTDLGFYELVDEIPRARWEGSPRE
ncbi:MAG: DUF1572 domain-containing protein [Gemmatimonas sp.]|nr:DUF1572 domain-containing protein [Gemmatimonas sp.]